MVGAWD